MSEYLTKEEIKQWRSSLEKVTLEEYAARLGKKVEQKKETNDLIDIVLHGQPVVSAEGSWSSSAERLSSIAERAYEKEKDLYVSQFSMKNLKLDADSAKADQKAAKAQKPAAKKVVPPVKDTKAADKTAPKTSAPKVSKSDSNYIFKKALTDREQKVFDYFAQNEGKIVYAKDLAILLDLPRDYVYKYIKNLRAKIEGEALKNADKGGFVLSIK